MRIALINTNRMRPPIAPIGLEYVAEAMHAAGHDVVVLDLCWEDDWRAAMVRFFAGPEFELVGLTLRNTDDCGVLSRQSFLPDFAEMVRELRTRTAAPLVVGGVGFSVMPERVLERVGADVGIWGEGEFALAEFARSLETGGDGRDVPGLIWKRDGAWVRNPPTFIDLAQLPRMTRRWFDNPRYFREGGQGGFETKRGCPNPCIYCADPVAKGQFVRLRPPAAVADEIECLLALGVDHLHTCDSEFNLVAEHVAEVCREMVRRGLGARLRWYAYCAPVPFGPDLARLMREAGCEGINFGADSGDAAMLRRLRRGYTPDDIVRAVDACRLAGITTMLDLLLGAPGETRASLVNTVRLMKQAAPDRVGVSFGVQVYPGTELAAMVQTPELKAGVISAGDADLPPAFIAPAVADDGYAILDAEIAGDERFLFFDPRRTDTNYNYNANQRLVDAIKVGHRGAYWDILRRLAAGG
ncbi:MAG: hypothetical protein A3K19_27205 [Lentisphaerae bacterium RIFOXYB12_FULL_65_16]|nr:MAG: hypothetical protein A3K18_16070 [Lentisphaerae bacterium RIFOXYA12_64_32]OGV86378.1 MAG: hypothetical protein A3K19_27205 [Lentisphaerae bacterium RIFOXYB12_FULL_65_16]